MGRHPANGGPSFRFSSAEVTEMEAILQKHEGNVPARDFLMALAQSFSSSADRAGKSEVQMKQVWSWFQNRRFARKGKVVKSPGPPITSPVTRDQVTALRNVPGVAQKMAVSSGPRVVNSTSEDPQMEFEAKSARDGAWYDVQAFVSHRNLETDNPEVRVRFAGFEPEEDEWVSVLKHVRQRSLPCEAAECIIVGPGDLILCFQEGKEQALYFDAHVLDAQRRRHDVRGCRCRFLVRYDHDESEEIVPLRKICRRPETDHRLQVLHAANETAPPASVPTEPPKPVAVAATAAAVSIPTPPIVSAAPSVQTSATQASTPTFVRAPEVTASIPVTPSSAPSVQTSATQASTPTLVRAPEATTSISAPPSSALPVSPEPKKIEPDNPAPVRVPEPIEVKTENTALSNLKIEGGASVPAPPQIKVESVNLGTSYDKPDAAPNITAPAAAPNVMAHAAANTVVSENTNPETTATTRSEISKEQPATASIDPSNTALESDGTNEAMKLNQQPESTTITIPTTYQ